MPSNKDLIDQARKLAEELGEPAPKVDGLKNDDLLDLVNELEQKLEARMAAEESATPPTKPATPSVMAAPQRKQEAAQQPAREPAKLSEPEAPVAPMRKGYAVAKGRAITTKRGLLTEGTPVRAEDFHAGEERLEELAVAGVLVKR